MAGTLTVQNIEGPSSGANANKVIIPAGQTLDVSGGTFTPSAGQIVQVATRLDTSSTGTSSASLTNTGVYVSITPKFASSKILVQFIGTSYTSANGIYVIYRDTTSLISASHAQVGNFNSVYTPSVLSVVDEPSTTSAVSYYIYQSTNGAGDVYWPPGSSDTTQCIAMEIAQ